MTKTDSDVPQPGPARLSKGAGPDEWLAAAKECKYLPEADMKRLCEIVKECLMEGELDRLFGVAKCGTEDAAYSDGERILLTSGIQNPTSNPSEPLLPFAAISMANSTTYSSCSA